jgi:hypothetical protein
MGFDHSVNEETAGLRRANSNLNITKLKTGMHHVRDPWQKLASELHALRLLDRGIPEVGVACQRCRDHQKDGDSQ